MVRSQHMCIFSNVDSRHMCFVLQPHVRHTRTSHTWVCLAFLVPDPVRDTKTTQTSMVGRQCVLTNKQISHSRTFILA
jgi:hypothetical protein